MSKTCFVMLVVGAAAGSAATWLYAKKYYERIAQEEIDSVKAVFSERKPDTVVKIIMFRKKISIKQILLS